MAATKRIGALVPATNPVVEPDFHGVLPPEVTVHFERMFNRDWGYVARVIRKHRPSHWNFQQRSGHRGHCPIRFRR